MSQPDNNLRQKFVKEEWKVVGTIGKSKPSFEATKGEEHIFVKSELVTPSLVRLSETGVALPVKYVGEFEGKEYFAQDFFEGKYPDEIWFETHQDQLAKYIKRLHDDKNWLSY